jgi:hypothetical protein
MSITKLSSGKWTAEEDVLGRQFYKKHIAEMVIKKEMKDHVWIYDWTGTRKTKKNVTQIVSMFRRNSNWSSMFSAMR